ncbi:MAG: hypothetical protein E7160_05155 [Firmicutes bacterium]|nr:hypothetical protein [Bacillota bacterium]
MKKSVKIPIILLFTFMTAMLMTIDINIGDVMFGTKNMTLQFNELLKSFDVIDTLICIIIYWFYYNTYFISDKMQNRDIKIGLVCAFLSFAFAGIQCIHVIDFIGSMSYLVLVFQFFVMFFGMYIVTYAIGKKIVNLYHEL